MPGVELVLGGQKSGKSRRAELLALAWLAGAGMPVGCAATRSVVGGTLPRQATLIATAQPWDAEMRQRIARHQVDRARRVPGLATLEEPLALAEAITRLSSPRHLLVVDCLTLWLTNLLMPMKNNEQNTPLPLYLNGVSATQKEVDALLAALATAPGPVVLVGNEIGLGVIPMGAQVRAFVDALGLLNQRVAAQAQRVVLMVSGLPVVIKQEQ